MTNVKRGSPNDKLNGLVNAAPGMFTEMDHLSYLKTLRFNFTSQRLETIQDIGMCLAFLINGTMVYAYNRKLNNGLTYVTINQL